MTRARVEGAPNRSREARKLAGLTVEQAARLLKIPAESLVDVEAWRGPFAPDLIARLSEVYDVHPTWLSGASPGALAPDDPRVDRGQLAKIRRPADRDKLLRTLAAVLGPPEEPAR